MNYSIEGEPLPVVICNLEANETMITEKGAMSWMTPTMQMQTGLGSGAGGFLGALGKMAKSAVTGESIFRNTYTGCRLLRRRGLHYAEVQRQRRCIP